MKKTIYILFISFLSLLVLIACAEKDDHSEEKQETTLSVETTEITTVPVISVENMTTTTQSIQTTSQTSKLNLNNELEGSYKIKGIELSVPAYLNNKEEKEDSISFSGKGIGGITFMVMECNSSEAEYKLAQGELENAVQKKVSELFDSIEKIQSKNAYICNKEYEYGIYKGTKDDKNANVYITTFFDDNSKLLYFVWFLGNDMYGYDFESDFVNILKNIKMVDYTSENDDMLKIDRTFLSTDWSGNTVLVVEYTWKNTSDKTTSFMWAVSTQCFQNGVECDTALFCDDVDSGDLMKDVMPGYSITVREAYVIKDMSDVTIKCNKYLSSDAFLETTVKLG